MRGHDGKEPFLYGKQGKIARFAIEIKAKTK